MPFKKDPITGKTIRVAAPTTNTPNSVGVNDDSNKQLALIMPADVYDIIDATTKELNSQGIEVVPGVANNDNEMGEADFEVYLNEEVLSPSGVVAMNGCDEIEQTLLNRTTELYGLPFGARAALKENAHKDVVIILDDSGSMVNEMPCGSDIPANISLNFDELDPADTAMHLHPNAQIIGRNTKGAPIKLTKIYDDVIANRNGRISGRQEQDIYTKQALDLTLSVQRAGSIITVISINNLSRPVIANIPKFTSVEHRDNIFNSIMQDIDRMQFTNAATPLKKALLHVNKYHINTNNQTIRITNSDGGPSDDNIWSKTTLKTTGEKVAYPKGVYEIFASKKYGPDITDSLRKIGPGADWMDAIDENCDETLPNGKPNIHRACDAIDDVKSEDTQISDMQGPEFVAGKGLNILKAVCPGKYDMLDSRVLSKTEIEEYRGTQISQNDYDAFVENAVVHRYKKLGSTSINMHILSATGKSMGDVEYMINKNGMQGLQHGFSGSSSIGHNPNATNRLSQPGSSSVSHLPYPGSTAQPPSGSIAGDLRNKLGMNKPRPLFRR